MRCRWIRWYALCVVVAVTLMLGGGIVNAQGASSAVTLAMSWLFDGTSVGFLAAEQGFYGAEGVKVDVTRGFGADDTIRRVTAGKVDFGVVDATLLIKALSVDPNNQMVMLAAIFQKSPYNVIYVKGRHINSIADLATAKFGDTGGSVGTLYPTFLKFALGAKESLDRWKELQLQPASRIPALLRGDVDVVGSIVFEWPEVTRVAKQAGLEMGSFAFADYGFDPYTYGIVANRSYLARNPQIARAVVEGSLKGWAWACANPEMAGALLAQREPDVPRADVVAETKIAIAHVVTGDALKEGIGYMSAKRWQQTEKDAVLGYSIKQPVPVQKVYDTHFLPTSAVYGQCR